MSEKPATLAAALAAFQANLPAVFKTETAKVPTKTGGSYSYSYANLAQVANAVMARMGPLGLSFVARPTLNADGRFVLAYDLMHEGGDKISGEYPLPSTGTAQEWGSAITYARRYTLCSVTGVAPDEDDDGAAASTARTDATYERSSRPALQWDAADQAARLAGWLNEINKAKTPEQLRAIGQRLLVDKQAGELAPAFYEKAKARGLERVEELEAAAGHPVDWSAVPSANGAHEEVPA